MVLVFIERALILRVGTTDLQKESENEGKQSGNLQQQCSTAALTIASVSECVHPIYEHRARRIHEPDSAAHDSLHKTTMNENCLLLALRGDGAGTNTTTAVDVSYYSRRQVESKPQTGVNWVKPMSSDSTTADGIF